MHLPNQINRGRTESPPVLYIYQFVVTIIFVGFGATEINSIINATGVLGIISNVIVLFLLALLPTMLITKRY